MVDNLYPQEKRICLRYLMPLSSDLSALFVHTVVNVDTYGSHDNKAIESNKVIKMTKQIKVR